MNEKLFETLKKLSSSIVAVIGIISVCFTIVENKEKSSTLLIALICALFLIVTIIFNAFKSLNRDKEVEIVEKWIRYNKKREEIDAKIARLNNQIMYYDKTSYLDLNRMIFSAQSTSYSNKMINYNNFILQFGLDVSQMSIKKGSALFLTPFTTSGEKLYRCCRDILERMDIFLQRTDNYMEKEDIMMNIVSMILQSEIVIVNINERNPNVYYELGISHALGKPTILLSEDNQNILSDIGFDIRQKRIIIYKNDKDLKDQLLYIISNIKRNI